jgi:glycosyltransferase involved in cell wall biosynthesis
LSTIVSPAYPSRLRSGASVAVPVVIFTNSWAMGGMEQHIIDLGRTLSRRGRRVAVICYASPAIAPLHAALQADGVDVYEFAGGTGLTGRARALSSLLKILRRYPGCVLHLSESWPAGDGLVVLAARLVGATAIIRTEHQPPVAPIARRQRLLTRLKDRFLARVVCVSEDNRQRHIVDLGRDPANVMVIPNGIDVDAFSSAGDTPGVRAEFGISPEAPIVGLVARLAEERKGGRYFIEMAASVARYLPHARFLVVGDGPMRRQFQRQVEELGIASVVVFTGERQDVPRLLASMTVFVQPSLEEGASLVLLEAMAAALPVVVTPAGSVPELIVDGENGLIVPMRNSQALADAVIRLLDDPALAHRIAGAARDLVCARLSVETMVDRYEALYQQVAPNSR